MFNDTVRRILLCVLAAVLVLVSVGCSGGTEEVPSATEGTTTTDDTVTTTLATDDTTTTVADATTDISTTTLATATATTTARATETTTTVTTTTTTTTTTTAAGNPISPSVLAMAANTTTGRYVANPDSFVPVWADEWTAPAWMHDWEEKVASFKNPNGRLMSCAHRGDHVHYPENSIEGILSAIAMGIDMVEVDIQVTKDKIPVLMHDATLTATTNVAAVRASDPSLPASDAIDQWTYEQLLKLRLKNGFHGAGQVTDCCIPTLEQAIQVCKDKILITPDKLTTWIDAVFKDIVVRNQAYQTLLIGYGTNTRLASRIQTQFNDAYGKAPMFMANVLGVGGGFAALCDRERLKSTREVMEELNMDPIVRCGEFYNGETITEYADVLADLRGKYRLYVEALLAGDDVEKNWEAIKNAGACTLITNRAFDLCQYIAASYNG